MVENASKQPRLWVEAEFSSTDLATRLAKLPASSPYGLPLDLAPIGPADYPRFGRNDLLLTRHRGDFVKPCPGTLNYNCCGLQIFHFGLGCTLGCRYCILEAYLGTEAQVLFGNVEEGLADLVELLDHDSAPPLRYCTGEFTDSLLLDRRTGLGSRLVEIFSRRTAVVEFKTKTDQVDHLLNLDHRGHTIISFSVNAPAICQTEESCATPLEARLKAARKVAEAGYPVGLHFDPLIFHPGWEGGYERTTELIGDYLTGYPVAWVSLGAFRYLPSLKEVMLSHHPTTFIYDGEFILGGDGKMRYPRPLRTGLYRHLKKALGRVLSPDTTIYMCMESSRLWRDVFGTDPGTEGLTGLLDKRARELIEKAALKLRPKG